MRIKIFISENTKEMESSINEFLIERKDIKVIDIKEIFSRRSYIFFVIYEIKE